MSASPSPLPRQTLEELRAKMLADKARHLSENRLQPIAEALPQPVQQPKPGAKARPQIVDDGIGCDYEETVRLEPGTYWAKSVSATVRWDDHPKFKRWSCVVVFEVRDCSLVRVLGKVPFFMNLANRPERPHAGKRSRYWQEWCRANGGLPRRGDRLSPKVFRGRGATVIVGDVTTSYSDRRVKLPEESQYSVIREITSWETPRTNSHTPRLA